MIQYWAKVLAERLKLVAKTPVKSAAILGTIAAVHYLLWAALVVACIVGAVVAVWKYLVHPVLAIIWAIVAYRFIKELYIIFFIEDVSWSRGESAEERQRFEALTPEEKAAERSRRNFARVTRWVITIVIALCAYLIFR